MELEKAKKGLKRFCEYEGSIVLTDNALYEVQEMVETVLKALENSVSKEKIIDLIDFAIKATNTNDNYSVGMRNGMRYIKKTITNDESILFEKCIENEIDIKHILDLNDNATTRDIIVKVNQIKDAVIQLDKHIPRID